MNDSESEIERLKRRVEELEKAQPTKRPYQPPVWFKYIAFSLFASMGLSVLSRDMRPMLFMFSVFMISILYMAFDDTYSGK